MTSRNCRRINEGYCKKQIEYFLHGKEDYYTFAREYKAVLLFNIRRMGIYR
jgi:hypothetical protein